MLYSCAALETLHPELARYLLSEVPQRARINEQRGWFEFERDGRTVTCGGIHTWLERLYYPHYVKNRSKRDHSRTVLVGSSTAQGRRVDTELELAVEGRAPGRWDKLTRALLEHWRAAGHTLQACQVPVELANGWDRMTKADVITRCEATGALWLWEVKCGAPVGFYRTQRKQPTFASAPLSDVPCTEQNIWFLQLHYTHQALVTRAALPIDAGHARIIQVYVEKGQRDPVVRVRIPPKWLTQAVPLRAGPPAGVPVLIRSNSKKKRPRREEAADD